MEGFAGLVTDLPFGPVVGLVLGALLLLAGRRLFWFAVGIVGFVAGFTLAARLFTGQEPWVELLAGIFAGLLGAGLAVLLQRFAVAVAGFLVGGAGAAWIAETAFAVPEAAGWVVFLVAGVVCALVASLLFEAALIVISALLGAAMVVDAVALGAPIAAVAFLALAALGMAVQTFTRPRERNRHRRRRRED